jgi:hypothetical protein
MEIILRDDKNQSTQLTSSGEAIREPKFKLVKDLKIGESYNILLLVLFHFFLIFGCFNVFYRF